MSWRSKLQSKMLVAASNSSDRHKAIADYICNGSNDAAQIRAAIAAAQSPAMWPAQMVFYNKAFMSVVKISDTEYHGFYTQLSPTQQVCHATSVDGMTWVDDTAHNPIFAPTGTETAIGVFNVWKEGATWYAIYRYTASGVQSDGLATSVDGISWTRSPSNPILSITAGESGPLDPWAIIKVSNTYYLYYNAVLENGGDRYINYATSTNLTSWTKATANGGYILRNGAFCPTVFKLGDYYYIITSKYVGFESVGVFVVHRSLQPTFEKKTFVGVIATQASVNSGTGYSSESVDTPWVLCADVTRILQPTDPLWCYFESKLEGSDDRMTALMTVDTAQEAIDRAGIWADVKLLPGEYKLNDDDIYIDSPMNFDASEATLFSTLTTTRVYVAGEHCDVNIGTLVVPNAEGIGFTANRSRLKADIANGNVYVEGRANDIDIKIGSKTCYLYGAEHCKCLIETYDPTYGVSLRKLSRWNHVTLRTKLASTAVRAYEGSSYNIIDGMIDCDSVLLNADSTTVRNKIQNAVISGSFSITDSGTRNEIRNNIGYIGPGEIRTIRGTIATLTQNAYNSVDNPFGQNVAILDLDIYVSTAATSTSPNIDCGVGSSATTDYTNLFDDLPGETVGFYNSKVATPGAQTQPILWASGGGNRYLNMSIKDEAATGMVATYVVTVVGL